VGGIGTGIKQLVGF